MPELGRCNSRLSVQGSGGRATGKHPRAGSQGTVRDLAHASSRIVRLAAGSGRPCKNHDQRRHRAPPTFPRPQPNVSLLLFLRPIQRSAVVVFSSLLVGRQSRRIQEPRFPLLLSPSCRYFPTSSARSFCVSVTSETRAPLLHHGRPPKLPYTLLRQLRCSCPS